MLLSALLLVVTLAAGPGWAHFLLRLPPSLGYLLENTGVSPCGGFSFEGIHPGTNYSVRGYPFAATSTVPRVTYTVKVRLLKEPKDVFHDILPPLFVSQYGTFCMPSVPVNPDWAGEVAEYHVISNDVTSTTYQCSLVQFVDQVPFNASSRSECVNTTGVFGALQPWGSNITTYPTPVVPTPTSVSSDVAGGAPGGAQVMLGPWLVLGFPIAVAALPFLLALI